MRKFNAREINHLLKYKIDPYELNMDQIKEKPVEYITGFAEFGGLEFKVNENVLIPRIETEEIIEIALGWIQEEDLSKLSFADVGTGSGCIGLTLALELQEKKIKYQAYLVDKSEEALKVTRENKEILIEQSELDKAKSEINIIQSDLLDNVKRQRPNVQLNLIIANLPYIPSSRISKLNASVKDYEPNLALDGGEDGLFYIGKLLEHAKEILSKDGLIILEVDDTHDKNAAKEFSETWNIEVKNDQFGKNRFWIVQKISIH